MNKELNDSSYDKFIGPESTVWHYVVKGKNSLKNGNQDKVSKWRWDYVAHDGRQL